MSQTKKPKKTSSQKAIVDVEEPGTSAPSATSRPVIVTNRPILKDPMVKEEAEPEDETENKKTTAVRSSAGKKIKPLTAPVLEEADDKKDDDDTIKNPGETAPKANNSDATTDITEEKPTSNQPTSTAPEPEEVSVAAEDDVDGQASQPEPSAEQVSNQQAAEKTPPDTPLAKANQTDTNGKPKSPATKQAEAEAAEQAKHDAAVHKLVDSKKYELPINAVEKRKTKHFVILGLLLAIMLALAWADIALDAGIIHVNGIKPVTHFFSN